MKAEIEKIESEQKILLDIAYQKKAPVVSVAGMKVGYQGFTAKEIKKIFKQYRHYKREARYFGKDSNKIIIHKKLLKRLCLLESTDLFFCEHPDEKTITNILLYKKVSDVLWLCSLRSSLEEFMKISFFALFGISAALTFFGGTQWFYWGASILSAVVFFCGLAIGLGLGVFLLTLKWALPQAEKHQLELTGKDVFWRGCDSRRVPDSHDYSKIEALKVKLELENGFAGDGSFDSFINEGAFFGASAGFLMRKNSFSLRILGSRDPEGAVRISCVRKPKPICCLVLKHVVVFDRTQLSEDILTGEKELQQISDAFKKDGLRFFLG